MQNNNYLLTLRHNLEAQRAAILVRESRTRSESLALDTDELADENDLAGALLEQNMQLRMQDRERRLLFKINSVLRRMDAGDYGECQVCGDEIDIRRLQARPMTTLCIDCKEDAERSERQYHQHVGGAARFSKRDFDLADPDVDYSVATAPTPPPLELDDHIDDDEDDENDEDDVAPSVSIRAV